MSDNRMDIKYITDQASNVYTPYTQTSYDHNSLRVLAEVVADAPRMPTGRSDASQSTQNLYMGDQQALGGQSVEKPRSRPRKHPPLIVRSTSPRKRICEQGLRSDAQFAEDLSKDGIRVREAQVSNARIDGTDIGLKNGVRYDNITPGADEKRVKSNQRRSNNRRNRKAGGSS
jgi:hypothetical protein